MLQTLKFVKAAICKQGYDPARLCFRFRGGRVQANNGKLAIEAPVATDIDCSPNAAQLLKALSACEDVVSLHLEAGRLVVKSGRFKSHVDCVDNASFKQYVPLGDRFGVSQPLLPVLHKLFPFVATDENRPWACGVHIANNSAIATNSICMVEHWLPFAFPIVANIPRDAIAEVLRLKLEPESLQVCGHVVTFHLPGDAWISCTLTKHEWPDIQKVFDSAASYSGPFLAGDPLTALLDDVDRLAPFVRELGAVYFHKGAISNAPEGEPGTSIETPYSPGSGAFRADQVAALRGVVDRIGFNAYPSTIPFYSGSLLRGVMSGFRI